MDSNRLDQVLGADVAGVAAAVLHLGRMPADAAEGGIEMPHAGLVGGDVVDEPGAARVVEVGDGDCALVASFRKDLFTESGSRHAGGVADRHVLHAQCGEARNVLRHAALGSTLPSKGQPKATDTVPTMRKRPPAVPHHLLDVGPLLGAAALQVLLRVRFGGGDEQADLVDAVAGVEIGKRSLDCLWIRTGCLVENPGSRARTFSSSLASANCGTTFGLEYEVASTRGKPIAAKRSTSARLVAVGMKAGSCCSPSRAKHSQSVTSRHS